MEMKRIIITILSVLATAGLSGQSVTRLEEGWKFAYGNAADPANDFGRGTEYFNYLTKAASIHNEGPYVPGFDDSGWAEVRVPHDWAATLPCDSLASHSHGYKTVGWKYPRTSAGWYRLRLPASAFREGRSYALRFDGIFRDANVWLNGIWMGNEPSGYAVQVFDITPYIDFGGENLLCVRADATFEEGWFYEGAGIYRPVYLLEKGPVHPTEGGIRTGWEPDELSVSVELHNSAGVFDAGVKIRLLEADGKEVCAGTIPCRLRPGETATVHGSLRVEGPRRWDVDDPYLYTLETSVGDDVYRTPVGIRTAEFNAADGFLLNGRKVTLRGVNLHQDHAGVGAAMPDGLIEWRLRRLMSLGVNAIRCSHNPASPVLLDACDRLGLLVIDENRLMGTNDYHMRQLENMVRFGAQHPSVILWSVGNEEWGLENDVRGLAIARAMQQYVHLLDPTRPTTLANAGGGTMFRAAEVKGYNYIVQNDVERRHREHPEWIAYGSEETTGCGTRGVYALSADGCYPPAGDGLAGGRMVSLNRTGDCENVIERGWKYYAENPWTAGVFFWTGLDYRGEPNPLKYPAVGSEFGILDYCGFPKDEAWFLRAWWTSEPVLHVFPHWNPSIVSGLPSDAASSLRGRASAPVISSAGEQSVDLWIYSNAEEVELRLNGRSLGRKAVPRNGHLVWPDVLYRPGKVVATGYTGGRRVSRDILETTGPAVRAELSWDVMDAAPDSGSAVAIVTVRLVDAKGRFVPDACPTLTLSWRGPGRILGGGNGDPAFQGVVACSVPACCSAGASSVPASDSALPSGNATSPRTIDGAQAYRLPAFNGLAQLLIELPAGSSPDLSLLTCTLD